MGWVLGVGGKPKAGYTIHWNGKLGTELLCLQQSKETATVHVLGQDDHEQQFDTPCSLISAPQWHRIPHSGPS